MLRTVAADPSAADLLLGLRAREMRVRRGIDPARPADLWALSGEDAEVRLAALRASGNTTPAVILGAAAPAGRAPLEPVARVLDGTLLAFRDAARRADAAGSPTLLEVGGGIADLVRRRFVRDGISEALGGHEADLLAYLAARPGRVVARSELQIEVWGLSRPTASTRAVDSAVVKLRDHLGAALRSEPRGLVLDLPPPAAPSRPALLAGRLEELRTVDALALLAEIEAALPALRRDAGPDARRCMAAWQEARGAVQPANSYASEGRAKLDEALALLGADPKRAKKLLDEAREEPSLRPLAEVANRARIGLGRGSRPKAIAEVDSAIARFAEAGAVHDAVDAIGLAIALRLADGAREATLALARSAEELEHLAPNRRLAARLALRTAELSATNGQTEAALEALDRHRAQLPASEWRGRTLRATLLLANRKHQAAIEEARAMDAGRAPSPRGVRLQVLAALDQGRPRRALELLDQTRTTTQLPEDQGWHRLLTAAARHLVGDLVGAASALASTPPAVGQGLDALLQIEGWALALERGEPADPPDNAPSLTNKRALDASTRDDHLPVGSRIAARIALRVAARSPRRSPAR